MLWAREINCNSDHRGSATEEPVTGSAAVVKAKGVRQGEARTCGSDVG